MESKWERRKILIWGKTRPELSKKYREVVCTGGVFEDTKQFVRLYPIPLRYMDDERVFAKYQWIEAFVTRSESDPRPESYKIRADGIIVLNKVKDWAERAEWIKSPCNVFSSVETLKNQWQRDHTSLGLVKPRTINSIRAVKIPKEEKIDFWRRYEEATLQMELPLDPDTRRPIKPLKPADFRYVINFTCDDPTCSDGHNFSVRDWELDALYFRLRQKGDNPDVAAQKVVDKLHEVTADDRDFHFYLGNISTHPHQFTVVGLWTAKKTALTQQLKFGFT